MRDVEAIWAVSEAVSKYFDAYGDLKCEHVPNHPWIYSEDPQSLPFYGTSDCCIGARRSIDPRKPLANQIVLSLI